MVETFFISPSSCSIEFYSSSEQTWRNSKTTTLTKLSSSMAHG